MCNSILKSESEQSDERLELNKMHVRRQKCLLTAINNSIFKGSMPARYKICGRPTDCNRMI